MTHWHSRAVSVGRLPDITCGTTTSTASPTLRAAHLVPEPPYGEGRVAADGGATAMTDVSDGLLADLGHIADASGVGINVSTAELAVDRDALADGRGRDGVDAWAWVLGGGEDHALVATFLRRTAAGVAGDRTVLDGPPRVLVDGDEWTEVRAGSHLNEPSR